MTKKVWLILLSIFSLALLLRFIYLGNLPKAFYEDEVLIGYIGRYILQNGKDVYGNSWPLLYFNKFNDYYIILPMYLSGLSTFLFGVNEFAVRFPTALIGSLLVFPVYWLVWLLFKHSKMALIAASFIAISPWHIVLSRASTESVIEATIITLGICFLIKGITTTRIRWLIGSIPIFLIAYDTYHSARLYTPLILFGIFIIFAKSIWKNKRVILTYCGLILSFFILTLYIISTPWGKGRLLQTSIFNEQSGVQIQLNELIYGLGDNKVMAARIFHNKLIGYSREYLRQYLSHLSPEFLIFNGWRDSRYAVPLSGPIGIGIFVLFLLGLLFYKEKIKTNKQGVLVIIWLMLIASAPSAVTVLESPSVRRALFLVVPLSIISAYGLVSAQKLYFRKFPKIRLSYMFIALISFEFIFFLFNYYFHHDLVSSLYRSDGYREVVKYASAISQKGLPVYLSSVSTLPIYYLFFTNDFSSDYIGKFRHNVDIDQIGAVTFVNHDCLTDYLPTKLDGSAIILDRYTCNHDLFKYTENDQITGVNRLLGFRSLIPTIQAQNK